MTSTVFTFNLSGSVRHQGLSISGVTVSLFELGGTGADSLVGRQRTGSRGEFTFGVCPGAYRIEIEPDPNTRFLRTFNEMNVNGNTVLNVGLVTGSILKVKAVTKSGAAVTSGEVIALANEPLSYRSSVTAGSDGKYALTLPKGRFNIGLRYAKRSKDDDQRASSLPFLTSTIVPFDLQADDSLEFILPDMCHFEGRVTDIFGVPAANVKVKLTPASQDNELLEELGLDVTCVTDSTGEFQALVESGVYDISIEPDQAGLLFAATESNVEVFVDLKKHFQLAEGFRLRGQVQYELTQLAQCLVRIQGLDRKIDLLTKTDENGQFSVGVPGGTYKLVVSAHPKHAPSVTLEGSQFSGLAPWTRMIVVGGDTQIPVRLVQGTRLYGRIADESGHTRTGVKVSVYADDDNDLSESELDVPLSTCMTDSEGKYSFFIAPGSYWLAVHTDLSNAQRIEIGTEPKNLDIDWHGWCQVKFEVVSESGQKVPRCRVAYSPYGNAITGDGSSKSLPKGSILTDPDGVCNMTIPAGVYSLRFSPPSDSAFEPKTVKQISISHDVTKTIRLALKNSSQASEQ
ncbi:MAG: carboxypeptidase regulatory-like domain-containing protein [Candidatus Melainabacteria bacterium]|nr:carboxypeptidase regulatory-like domain-containing protein [Candidatus Melainabacteria bacterium]